MVSMAVSLPSALACPAFRGSGLSGALVVSAIDICLDV